MNEGTTHYAGCIQAGLKHYECALQEIGRLRLTITDLRVKLETAGKEIEVQKAKADKHYELGTEYFDLMVKAEREIATLRDALSRLVEVHDAMGGKCGTVRIAAEEALLGKTQSEYICTCGIRVTPHRCPTNNGF